MARAQLTILSPQNLPDGFLDRLHVRLDMEPQRSWLWGGWPIITACSLAGILLLLLISDILNKPANRQFTANKPILSHVLTRPADRTMTKHPGNALPALPEVKATRAKPVMTARRMLSDEQDSNPITLNNVKTPENHKLSANKMLLSKSLTKSKTVISARRSAKQHTIHHKRKSRKSRGNLRRDKLRHNSSHVKDSSPARLEQQPL